MLTRTVIELHVQIGKAILMPLTHKSLYNLLQPFLLRVKLILQLFDCSKLGAWE